MLTQLCVEFTINWDRLPSLLKLLLSGTWIYNNAYTDIRVFDDYDFQIFSIERASFL